MRRSAIHAAQRQFMRHMPQFMRGAQFIWFFIFLGSSYFCMFGKASNNIYNIPIFSCAAAQFMPRSGFSRPALPDISHGAERRISHTD